MGHHFMWIRWGYVWRVYIYIWFLFFLSFSTLEMRWWPSRAGWVVEPRIAVMGWTAWDIRNDYEILYLVGGLEHDFFDFPFSWECHHPNWRTPTFFRGVGIPPTRYDLMGFNWDEPTRRTFLVCLKGPPRNSHLFIGKTMIHQWI
jgi:hypothetical protein